MVFFPGLVLVFGVNNPLQDSRRDQLQIKNISILSTHLSDRNQLTKGVGSDSCVGNFPFLFLVENVPTKSNVQHLFSPTLQARTAGNLLFCGWLPAHCIRYLLLRADRVQSFSRTLQTRLASSKNSSQF